METASPPLLQVELCTPRQGGRVWAGEDGPCQTGQGSGVHIPPRIGHREKNLALYGQKSQCQLLLLLPAKGPVDGLMGLGMFSSTLPYSPLPSPGALETIKALALQPVWLISGTCKEAGSPQQVRLVLCTPRAREVMGGQPRVPLGGAGDLFKLR